MFFKVLVIYLKTRMTERERERYMHIYIYTYIRVTLWVAETQVLGPPSAASQMHWQEGCMGSGGQT